jgi:hypothetical protein
MKRVALIMLCLVILLAATTPNNFVVAKDTSNNALINLLAFAPDNQATRDSLISYTDYHALVMARPGAVWPKSPVDWQTLNADKDKALGLFNAALFGVSGSGADRLAQAYFRGGVEMQTATGINIYTVERTLSFGEPPNTMVILKGAFGLDAIGQAYQAHAYTKNDLKGLTMWCGARGCDDGLHLDMKNLKPFDPFGGDLGRQQPVVVAPDYVLSSPNLQVLTDSVAAYQGAASLANQPDYLAFSEVITQSGTLLQTLVIPTKILESATLIGKALPPDVLAKLRDKFVNTTAVLPTFSLFGFAHTINNDKVITYVALVYDNESDAKSAADLLPTFINQAPSVARKGVTIGDLITSRGGTIGTTQVYTSTSANKFVMLLPIESAVEPSEPANGETRLTASGLVYRLFTDALVTRDLLWLPTKDIISAISNP